MIPEITIPDIAILLLVDFLNEIIPKIKPMRENKAAKIGPQKPAI